jgi:hypothetical protein
MSERVSERVVVWQKCGFLGKTALLSAEFVERVM